jgi:hypothetical protein
MGLKRHDDYLDWVNRPPRSRFPFSGGIEDRREAVLAILTAHFVMLAFLLAWILID